MSDITNLTEHITHLSERKDKATFDQRNHSGKSDRPVKLKTKRERRFATDYFMIVAYSLLGFALLSQLFLIFWLDII